jgi:hypothetical protein
MNGSMRSVLQPMIVMSAAAVLTGCGGEISQRGLVEGSPPSSASAATTATQTASPSSAATASPTNSPAPRASSQVPSGFTCADANGGSDRTFTGVVAVRIGQHDGYDRFVIEFNGPIPAYAVRRQTGTTFTEDPRGTQVMLKGTHGVSILLHPVVNWTSYAGPRAFEAGFQFIKEARQVQNFEGYQEWALGIQGAPCLRVAELASPPRLVVDVASS